MGIADRKSGQGENGGTLAAGKFPQGSSGGVKMAFGTDAGVYPHGDNAKQFFYMVK
jgi:hypothetical protein